MVLDRPLFRTSKRGGGLQASWRGDDDEAIDFMEFHLTTSRGHYSQALGLWNSLLEQPETAD